jgi:hypothetical protein
MHAQGAENRVGEALGVAGRKFFAEYHAAQVEGAAEEVLGELEIAVGPDFPALNRTTEHLGAGFSSGIDEALGENCREVW